MMRAILSLGTVALLSACGQKADLEPAAGQTLPVAPYGTQARPTAEDLLEVPPTAAPERSVELRRRSEVREDDPFDLPPE
ncbi:MAG: lipoprotein [Pontixanthobacter sp.]